MATNESRWDSGSPEAASHATKSPGGSPPPLPRKKGPKDPSRPEAPLAAPVAKPADDQPGGSEQAFDDFENPSRLSFAHGLVRDSISFLISAATHLVLLIILGLIMLPQIPETFLNPLTVDVSETETEELTAVLDSEVLTTAEMSSSTDAVFSDAVTGGSGTPATLNSEPTLNREAVEAAESNGISFDAPAPSFPGQAKLIQQVPKGTLGEARAVVNDYPEALDRITQEILLMLAEKKVLVVWCFDQSESMKDDQQEIRDNIDRVYSELGLKTIAQGDALKTAVTSYGENFMVHTDQPTSRVGEIRDAIDQVPIDPSGKEMMCLAIGRSISLHRKAARGRHMALILVTDETGDRDNNDQYLEMAIQEAKDADCKLYVLGREAVFGYPYAHFRWVHPQTGHVHWLPVDRGPETAFVEQLQTNGFTRRYDAHASGFGPWEQARMGQQTGGIFFMLPSVESNLVRGNNRKYELEAMRAYHPDLSSKLKVKADNDKSILRSGVLNIIYSLNPYNPEAAKHIVMRMTFSPKIEPFKRQTAIELEKTKTYFLYLERAITAMEGLKKERAKEYSPRWQANIDLIHAQLIAYQVRLYEYGAYLEAFIRNPPKDIPLTKPPDRRFVHWDVGYRKETLTAERTGELVEKATAMFHKVIKDHPGTPWAERAQWELNRGYGIHLVPDYHGPPRKFDGPLKPIPKL